MVIRNMYIRVVIVMVVMVVTNCLTTTTQTPFEDPQPCFDNTCQTRETSPLDFGFLCQCDSLCNTYADCCIDSKYRNASLQVINEGSEMKCHALGVYMKTRCKQGWSDEKVEESCVDGSVDTDPLSLLPVTSNATGYTYRNYYCAICNEDILDLMIWNGELECDGLSIRDNVFSEDLIFRNNSWGVLRGSPESQEFERCSFTPQRPRDVEKVTRSCSVSISKCSEDWQDEEVEALCNSYTGVVNDGFTAYRNPHCAICNNIHNYECPQPEFFLSRIPVGFAMLFDFRDPNYGNQVGSTSPCNATQVWDPFFKRCRSIVCPKFNQDYRYGKCVTVGDVNSMEGSDPPATPPPITEASSSTTNNASEGNNTDPFFIRDNEINTTTTTNTSFTATPHNNTTNNNNSNNNNNNNNNSTPHNTTFEDVLITTQSSQTTHEDNKYIIFPEEPTETPTTPREDESVTTLPTTTSSPDVSTAVSPITDSTSSFETTTCTNTSSEFTECCKVNLLHGEFVDFSNGTVYVEAYERIYTSEEYLPTKEGIMVCLPETVTSQKFSAALGWVSLVGLSLSCICLLLHLVAFTLLPELRNLSGKNLASLCLALLAAYITLLVNMLMRPEPAGCVTLAAAMYYFFVTSFTWMNVIAFDVWYTFRLSQRQLRVSNTDQWHRFLAYSLYSWLVPVAATVILVIVNQLEPSGLPQEFLPRLGKSQYLCWFAHRKALLAFFAAPMITMIVFNCIFFVSTAAIITQTGSTAAAASARGDHPRNQYKMFLRLAVLMGFTWLSAIAAGYLNVEALWYVYVILNTLQGAFIFLAFTFRTKVWQGVGTTFSKVMQRAVSIVTRRAPPADIRSFELSHTPEGTSASYSTPNTTLEAC